MQPKKHNHILFLFLVTLVYILYLEFVFKLSIVGFPKPEYTTRVLYFSIAYAIILVLVIRALPRKLFKPVAMLLVIGLAGFYFAQDMYYRILSGFFSFSMTSDAHMGAAFTSRIMRNYHPVHLLYAVPVVLAVWLMVRYRNVRPPKQFFFYDSLHDILNSVLIAFLMFMTVVHTIPKVSDQYIESPYIYSDYDTYLETPSAFETIRKFGMLTYIQRDIAAIYRGVSDEQTVYDQIGQYLASRTEHAENLHTGLFEGKNLIMIMAESFDTYAIDPVMAPNLYAFQQDAWTFENYYSPLFFRNTADTEFMSQTGLYTDRSALLTMSTYAENLFPYTLPRLFAEAGYGTHSFHNYTDYFYPRSTFHPETLGYDTYNDAVSLGMLDFTEDVVIANHEWQSDLELMDKTLDILETEEEPYFAYVLTVSGHMPYALRNPMVEKNADIIEQLIIDNGLERPIDEIVYYHAANYELDLAVGHLMDRLEADGAADDTVVMIFGDHYAYGLDNEDIVLYDETKSLEYPLSLQRVPMMIHAPGVMPETFDQVFASIDIMPTLANLFGLNLDYASMFGKDIFGNQTRAVLFSDGSMLTDTFFYDLQSETYTFFDGTVTEIEAETLLQEYYYRLRINLLILEIDYFRLKRYMDDIMGINHRI
jgi:lipoteichoic acid synthase